MHGLGKMTDKKGKVLKYGVWEQGKLKTALKEKKYNEMKEQIEAKEAEGLE